jgi:hypothetical protein
MKFSITKVSSSGKKARPPRWWGVMVDRVPKVSAPWLKPKSWDIKTAQRWVDLIPSKCPFERQWWVGDTLVLFIPALCSLNPLSTQLYSIRLEAQTFLRQLESEKEV